MNVYYETTMKKVIWNDDTELLMPEGYEEVHEEGVLDIYGITPDNDREIEKEFLKELKRRLYTDPDGFWEEEIISYKIIKIELKGWGVPAKVRNYNSAEWVEK